jgi:carboxymethylenebutenolidase
VHPDAQSAHNENCIEHIWWDQATALRQAGILPSHLPFSDTQTGLTSSLRLPVVGVEGADMLVDESKGRSNEMLDPQWAVGNNA